MRARAFNTVAIWVRSVGSNAAIPMILAVAVLGVATGFDWLTYSGKWVAAVFFVGTVMTIPLSVLWAHLPGETSLERVCRERSQARARNEVRTMGLTPQQYMETIPAHDLIARTEAEIWLGIQKDDSVPKLRLAHASRQRDDSSSASQPDPN